MRVLHLISSGGMYGAEAVILNLSHALRAGGDESVIASFENASLQLHERALAQGLGSVLVPCQGQVSPATVRAIRDVVREQRVDMLHAHGYKADLYAWAALRRAGVPLVSTCHTWYDNDLALRVYGMLDRRVLRGYARVVAVSAEVEKQLLESGVPADRVRRIRNGIDLAPFATVAAARDRAPEHSLRVGLVGRLAPEKGVDLFIQAARVVVDAMPAVRFQVVGEGAERAALQAQIESLGLQQHVALAGHKEAMKEVYAGLDVLVSASRQEGLPVALLEGMASGLPLVGTAVGEVPTLLQSASGALETGMMVAPGDPRALADAILTVLREERLRLAMGVNAHALISREFSAVRMAAEYRTVYREAIAAGACA